MPLRQLFERLDVGAVERRAGGIVEVRDDDQARLGRELRLDGLGDRAEAALTRTHERAQLGAEALGDRAVRLVARALGEHAVPRRDEAREHGGDRLAAARAHEHASERRLHALRECRLEMSLRLDGVARYAGDMG